MRIFIIIMMIIALYIVLMGDWDDYDANDDDFMNLT